MSHVPRDSAAVARQFGNWNGGSTPAASARRGRMSSMDTLPPALTQSMLMQAYGDANEPVDVHGRHGKCCEAVKQSHR